MIKGRPYRFRKAVRRAELGPLKLMTAATRRCGGDIDQTQSIPGGSERILVVEDNEDILEVTSAMLTTFGYRVVCARNGAEAIQIFESGQEFELLFSDVVMPNGMSGVEPRPRSEAGG